MTVLSVIVPAHDAGSHLPDCLAALRGCGPAGTEVIVVDDGSTDESAAIAARLGARVVRLGANAGAAAARNRGAAEARGDILLFVDADVAVAPDAVVRVLRAFAEDPGLGAVFGSYDSRPRAPGLVSRYRNLLHHYVHQTGKTEAFTFWSGCGAVRRQVFEAVGGFDDDAAWRSIEDVELGYRLRRAHHRIRLDRTLQGTHLKRWTLGSMIRTDALYRAAPWARLMRRDGAPPSDLNLRTDQRLSVALAVAAVVSLPLGLVDPTLLAPAMLCLAGVAALNRHLLAFLHAQGGMAFALACFPLHVVHYLSGAAGFAYGWLDGRRGA